MANLRVKKVNSPDSRTIKALFTNDLHSSISVNNVSVSSLVAGVPNPEIKHVSVRGNVLVVTVLPLTPFSQYSITFSSTNEVRFRSASEDEFLFEDDRTNVVKFLGAENPYNPIRDILVSFLKDNIYNLDHSTNVRTILNNISNALLKFNYDIGQTKNANYLSFNVTNERKIRGFGPFDRLGEEGAYEITRVGLTEENATLAGSISFDSFPHEPVSLQRIVVGDEVLEAGISTTGVFDGFTLTVLNRPVTKLLSLVIRYENETVYDYDTASYGYQIQDSKYDPDFAGTLVTLENNQFKMNEEVTNDANFRIPGPGDQIVVNYEYKSLGRFIDDSSVVVSQIISIVRETAPPLLTQFSLKKAPVVTAADNLATEDGVEFLDPQSETPFLTIHPAFLREVPFSLSGLPKSAGEYSIDYETGRVYVYGADTNNGTGYFPPAMSYNYRKIYVDNLDYTYNEDTKDVVASPLRELETEDAKISFNYEQTLVPDIDYKASVHIEKLNERIENRLKSSLSLQTSFSPITNVFKIFNETTSETYQLTRFSNDTIYFSANSPPRIVDKVRERAAFHLEIGETLFIESEFTNNSAVRVLKISLANTNIMGTTEDVIGSSYNSSVVFSRNDLFSQELYFDEQILSESVNTDRLSIGYYQVDYRNGKVYLGVEDEQDKSIGTITYRKPVIDPRFAHVIAVANIYNSISEAGGVNKYLNYSSFEDDNIYQSVFDYSDERFLSGDTTNPYTVASDLSITVTDNIKAVRHVFDAYDLNNSDSPTDFVEVTSFTGNIIYLDSVGVQKRETLTIGVGLTLDVNTGSSGIDLSTAISVVRVSDSTELIDGYETIAGNTITLSGANGEVQGEVVEVLYTIILNGVATPIVDYNRGDLFADYTYLADEILVSYEYGDNSIDHRESSTLEPGDVYYVSYKAGALRDSLLANFGSLIDIPELNKFDVDLDRENYRHILSGAMQSFTRGPTIPSMKALVAEVTRINPEIVESVFDVWSLGLSRLFAEPFTTSGDPELVKGKFDKGLFESVSGDFITFPVSSNLKLESGTLEMFLTPMWSGLDNDATLTFGELRRNGVDLLETQIYIGASSYNPTFNDDNEFSVQKDDELSPKGLPTAIHTIPTGMFIFYDEDNLKWKMLAKNQVLGDVGDGYEFTGNIVSSGGVYDVKIIPGLGEPSDYIRSGNSKIDFSLNIDSYDSSSPDGYSTSDGYLDGYSFDGIQFMADDEHYLFDFAKEETKNRFSLYKDGKGYLSFSVWDNGDKLGYKPGRKSVYTVSADIQDWEAQSSHHVAIAWSLNTYDKQDEMHLFIDGQETPNIIKYGGIPPSVSGDRFRSVASELVTGMIPKKIITDSDLTTIQGSPVVTSSTDFGAAGIIAGYTITIFETGFDTYVILSVSANELTLDENMSATLDDARFSVNPFAITVSTEIDIYTNIAVYRTDGYDGYEIEIPGVRADIPGYSISKNAFNENVLTILGPAEVGDRIDIKTFGLNHRRCREKVFIWGSSSSVLKTFLPPPINLDETIIRSVILPIVPIGPDNATLNLGNWEATLNPTDVSNTAEGRTLEVRITGGNVDFSTPTTVTFNGTSTGGVTETLTYSEPGIQYTTNKWMTITDIEVVSTPIITSKNAVSIEIKERYSLTYPNGNNSYPVIRYSYQTQSGLSLEGDGSDIISDENGYFADSDVGNLLQIVSPPAAAGIYLIDEKIDNQTVRLTTSVGSAFTDGNYAIFNISIGRSGFQNGHFFLEEAGFSNTPYYIPEGYYEFDYSAYLQVDLDPVNQTAYVGSDFEGNRQAKAVIDEFRILNYQLTDTRVGETLATGAISVTTDSNAIRPFRKNDETLVLLHFDSFPIINDADYIKFTTKEYVQSDRSVNARFGQAIVIDNKGLSFDNKGTLTTSSEGSIEFWVSPFFDTYNDPQTRVYFDAAAAVTEELTSLTKATVQTDGRISQVLSVRLLSDENNTGKEYFNGGSVSSDFRTINLNIPLPFQNTPVKVVYVPSGLQGDRLTIFKDIQGFITFNVRAAGTDIQVRQLVFWARDTWHRIRTTFKFNRQDNRDELRLFVDGEERGVILFGQGFVFGQGFTFGQNFSAAVSDQVLITDINLLDHLSRFYIGTDFTGSNPAKARIDNIKLSNISLDPLIVGSQAKDVYYNSNPDYIYPAIEDAYTTFLLDFDQITEKVTDFAILRDPEFGIFNFVLKIIDSFSILEDDPRVQEILEAMIDALKPATSKVSIEYYR